MGYLLLHSGQPSAKRLLRRVVECTGVEGLDPVASQDVVIRFGNTNGDDSRAAWTLNPRQAILNTTQRKNMLRILKQNGVYTPSITVESGAEFPSEVVLDNGNRVKVIRHYRVPIFDLQPLAVFRADSKDVWLQARVNRNQTDRFREVAFDEDVYATRAVRLAMRSLHALGLDFGVVTLGITARDRTICLNVNPAPILHGRMVELFEEAVNAFITRDRAETSSWERNERYDGEFKMGTDLEFMLRSAQGRMVLASKYLPRAGRVGCDDRSLELDGERFPLAEVRPDPATTPEELVANIRETLTEAQGLIRSRNVQWLAGSMPFKNFPLGGHIHFSDLTYSSRLVKVFDTYLGLPIMMLEANTTATKRRPKYGFLGDVRFKSHGGFEYRTPGSWLVSPEIALAVSALAYVVAVHHRDLTESLFISPAKQRQFYLADKHELNADFQRIWSQIEATTTYRRYQGALRIFPEMVAQGISWDEAVDIRRSWGLPIEKAAASRPNISTSKRKKRT
ncbi:putative amidoligase domain-containing protein [Tumebacillus permanentifrigoris]|uniref:PhiEco32-like amidoligase-type 2 protein n=1 Tax=Tumebacillus permanentifrigoris TaxID=378543 RepID=A0A316DBK6_9BACL|nr:hypothetical protein [Tumebacillus permanentifrigoris]PWK15517.1 phiEco32-like amidoligase-type 2 protein [Tumebacillus permanentifrigoris]